MNLFTAFVVLAVVGLVASLIGFAPAAVILTVGAFFAARALNRYIGS